MKALKFIEQAIAESGGVPPTYREIAAHCGVSPSNAHRLVECLIERGWVTRLNQRPRSLALVATHLEGGSHA